MPRKNPRAPKTPERVTLSSVERQALLSIYVEAEAAQRRAAEKAQTRETIVREILVSHGYDPECWLDVTTLEHGVVRVSADDPNPASPSDGI